MKRKRLTQVFPFLLPIRKWQRKKRLRLPMRFWAYIPPLNVLCPSENQPENGKFADERGTYIREYRA